MRSCRTEVGWLARAAGHSMTISPHATPAPAPLASTGIEGLDDVLGGGLTANQLYVIEGLPGTGKTTLALQFLMEGARRGEVVLHVSLSETAQELHAIAASHGWSLDRVQIHEVLPRYDTLEPDDQYTVFHPSEVELAEATKLILEQVERLAAHARGARLSLGDPPAGRLRAALPPAGARAEAVLHRSRLHRDDAGRPHVQGSRPPGAEHRARGDPARPGAPRVRRGTAAPAGLQVPRRAVPRRLSRLQDSRAAGSRCSRASSPQNTGRTALAGRLASGIAELDKLLGGGVDQGMSTLFVGAAGTGKSSLAAQFVAAAADRGQTGAMFIFDESIATLLERCDGLGIPSAASRRGGSGEAASDRSRRALAGRVLARDPPRRRAGSAPRSSCWTV